MEKKNKKKIIIGISLIIFIVGVVIIALLLMQHGKNSSKNTGQETNLSQTLIKESIKKNLNELVSGGDETTAQILTDDAIDEIADKAASSVTKSVMNGEAGIDIERIKNEIRQALSEELTELYAAYENENMQGNAAAIDIDSIAQKVYEKLEGNIQGQISQSEINEIINQAAKQAESNTLSELEVRQIIKQEIAKNSSGTTSTEVKNGIDGKDGKDGADGKTPVRGVDYMTESDLDLITNAVSESILESGDLIVTGIDGRDGEDGKNAYELAVESGYIGTQEEWLESLKQGQAGKSAYDLAVENGYTGTEEEWLESLKGETGDTGNTGSSGKSAYDVAVDNGYRGTEEEWLESLKGDTGEKGDTGSSGKSAYDVAVDNGFQGNEQDWLASLEGKSADEIISENGQYTSTENMINTIVSNVTDSVIEDMSQINEIIGDNVWNYNASSAGHSGPNGTPTITELINNLYEDYVTYEYDSTSNTFVIINHAKDKEADSH